MSRVTEPPPLQLLVGDPFHGVVGYAADVASALQDLDDRTRVIAVDRVDDATLHARDAARVHVHVTDRLWGSSPEEAARNLELMGELTRLTITVHDVPQTSDGTGLARRIDAYTRFFGAAEAVVVNSVHEQRLVTEFLPLVRAPHAIPLGARAAAPREPTGPTPDAEGDMAGNGAGPRDLAVLLAGYVYPGKGHAQAIVAAAEAGTVIRAAGERVGDVVVRAIGGPSTGHEKDVDDLIADAESRGIRFESTGVLGDDEFASRLRDEGIPLAAHQHISASRSMLDWVEAGRRPLVATSRYAREMAALRPATMTLYDPDELARSLVTAWREPATTWLGHEVSLAPTLHDVAQDYRLWWQTLASR